MYMCAICLDDPNSDYPKSSYNIILQNDKNRDQYLCRSCSARAAHAKSRDDITFDMFVDLLKNKGYIMLSRRCDYDNTKTPMWIQCGNTEHPAYLASYNKFKEHRCQECFNDDRRGYTIEELREEFAEKGWILLETKYVSNSTDMRCICKCGRDTTITLVNFRVNIGGCRECTNRYTYEEAEVLLEYEGCVLLGAETEDGTPEFVLNSTTIFFTCICDNEHFSSFRAFMEGCRCPECTDKKRIETCMKIYGVPNPAMHPDIIAKIRATDEANHGGVHHMQTAECLAKMQSKCYSTKHYTFPSGHVRQIQGYEHFALDDLLKDHKEKDIATGTLNILPIRYRISRWYNEILFS